jgi:hypothetical protein
MYYLRNFVFALQPWHPSCPGKAPADSLECAALLRPPSALLPPEDVEGLNLEDLANADVA